MAEIQMNTRKREKGSVTLYVLISMLFFLIILVATYFNISNRYNIQMREIEKIKAEYNPDKYLDEEYENVLSGLDTSINIYFKKETGEIYNLEEWTNQNIKMYLQIVNVNTTNIYFYQDDVKKLYTGEPYLIEKNCTIKVEFNGETQTKVIDKIDKDAPTVNLENDGGTFVIPTTDNAAKIKTTIDAIDTQSGLDKLEYVWSTSDTAPTEGWEICETGASVIKEGCTEGTYYLWTRVSDKVGNVATYQSNKFVVLSKGESDNQLILTRNPASLTNQNVIVSVSYGSALTGTKNVVVTGGTNGVDYKIDSNEKITIMTNNQTVTVTAEDISGNQITKTVTIDYIDKVLPVWSLSSSVSSTKLYGEDTITIPIKGTDEHYQSNTLTKDSITVKVGGTTITPTTKTLSAATSIDNGITYTLTLSGLSGTGVVTLELAENTLQDQAGNKNVRTTITTAYNVVAKPTVSISASATTMVAGNRITLTSSVSGTYDTINSYQWYYSTSNTAGSGTATGTSSSEGFNPSTSMTGTYYLSCRVTCTLRNKTVTITSGTIAITVQVANYSTVKSGVTTYYNTLLQAVNGATSGGGDTGGGTITVLNSCTDSSASSPIPVAKTIAINTNGKTVTRAESIDVSSGTLTIKGTGTLTTTRTDDCLIWGSGGNIATSGTPNLKAPSGSIVTNAGTSTSVNLQGGYVYNNYGTAATTVDHRASGNCTVNNTYIFHDGDHGNAFKSLNAPTTIVSGTSRIGNGLTDKSGTSNAAVVGTNGTSTTRTFIVQDSARIDAGPYAANAVGLYGKVNMSCTGSSSLYSIAYNCVTTHESGCSMTFNSTGYFYAGGAHVATASSYTATFTVTKGHFVSRTNKYMFYQNGAQNTTYVSTGSTGNRNFEYMTAYNSLGTYVVSNCYYYTRGV